MSVFKKATKTQIKLRLALSGPSGSGKTFSALAIASNLGQRTAVIDTERGSASRYADLFEFDVLELESFHPTKYIQAIKAAEIAGYEVVIIDSLSHAWIGKDGELDLVERAKNSFTAWKDVRPLERALIDAMLGCRSHLIATMRTKTEWVVEQNEKGKAEPRKVGTAPLQTQGIEYEFDVAGELNLQNTLTITKSRCPALSGQMFVHPGKEIADALHQWLDSGIPVQAPQSNSNGQLNQSGIGIAVNQANIQSTTNPNRDLLKRIAQLTGQSGKQIAEIIETNFPGLKSDQLNDLELRTVVDVMCVDAATSSGMETEKAVSEFSQWQVKQHPEIGNFELAKQWMAQLAVLSF